MAISIQGQRRPRRSSRPVPIGAIVAAVAALAVGGCLPHNHSGASESGSTESSSAKSPEDQIKTVVQRQTANFNGGNFSYNPELDCAANAKEYTAKHANKQREIQAQTGKLSTSVTNIKVSGNSATADITIKFENLPDKTTTQSAQFVREDGHWKDCTPGDSSDDAYEDADN
jgi:hypothetical protein